ncbi:MAG: DNA replication/repair protein RecF [Ruminococcaceae bacterium]|nr:DNA replication/repair protein RecF [Oscillospiraceae bacterium]
MKCKQIEFTNFRNMDTADICFSDGINVLWGKNAQGKSNILEGVYYFARGRSFRGAKDREMIRFGEDFSKLRMECIRDGATFGTDLEIILPADPKERKKVFRNEAPVSGISELIGSFRAVLFCPAHLSLVSGGPVGRRTFLDIAISQLSREYMANLSKYNRLLTQRTAALKSAAAGERFAPALWETFAEQMAECGSKIAAFRYSYISMMSVEMEQLFSDMTGGSEKPALTYVTHAAKPETDTSADMDDAQDAEGAKDRGEMETSDTVELGKAELSPEPLYTGLLDNLDKEIKYGATLKGIHKDDIRIRLNGKDAKIYASQGQMRSLALSMKLSEGSLAYTAGGEKPVILLDDVLSELDSHRQSFVLGSLADRQIIVTSCEPSLFESAGDNVCLFRVDNGNVEKM